MPPISYESLFYKPKTVDQSKLHPLLNPTKFEKPKSLYEKQAERVNEANNRAILEQRQQLVAQQAAEREAERLIAEAYQETQGDPSAFNSRVADVYGQQGNYAEYQKAQNASAQQMLSVAQIAKYNPALAQELAKQFGWEGRLTPDMLEQAEYNWFRGGLRKRVGDEITEISPPMPYKGRTPKERQDLYALPDGGQKFYNVYNPDHRAEIEKKRAKPLTRPITRWNMGTGEFLQADPYEGKPKVSGTFATPEPTPAKTKKYIDRANQKGRRIERPVGSPEQRELSVNPRFVESNKRTEADAQLGLLPEWDGEVPSPVPTPQAPVAAPTPVVFNDPAQQAMYEKFKAKKK